MNAKYNRLASVGFLVLCAVVLLSHLLTIAYSPMPWMDEVQTIEIAQGGLVQRSSTWSMCISEHKTSVQPGFQTWSPYYLGGWVQEQAYQLFGMPGPRLVPLLGLLLASALLYTYVKRTLNSQICAYLAAGLLLLDPGLTQSVRGARVDIYCFVLLFISLNLLAPLHLQKPRLRAGLTFACVGFISVVQLFVWMSSMMLFGILLVEIWSLLNEAKWNWKRLAEWTLAGAVGAALAAVLCVTPFLTAPYDFWGQLHHVVSANTGAKESLPNYTQNLKEYLACFMKSPLLYACGALALLVSRRNWKYLLFFALWTLFAIKTRVYIFRLIYFIPYFVLALVILLQQLGNHKARWVRGFVVLLSAGTLLFGLLVAVVIRNGSEYLLKDSRSHAALVETLRREVGPHASVYSDSFQVYYAGRELNWLQYRMAFSKFWEPEAAPVLEEVDYLLIEKGYRTDEIDAKAIAAGFDFDKQIDVPWKTDPRVLDFMKKSGRPLGYGPYLLYRRHKQDPADLIVPSTPP